MKTVLLVSLLGLSVSAFADHHDMESKTFEESQKMMMEGLDLKIAHLTASKTCVQSATTKEGLKKCRQDMKAKRKEMKEAMHSRHEAMKVKKDAKKANK